MREIKRFLAELHEFEADQQEALERLLLRAGLYNDHVEKGENLSDLLDEM